MNTSAQLCSALLLIAACTGSPAVRDGMTGGSSGAGTQPAAGDTSIASGGAAAVVPPSTGDSGADEQPPSLGATDAGPDARVTTPELDCSFTGEPRIEPADAEVSSPQQFTLVGVSALPAGCLRWSSSPSGFDVYNSMGEYDEVDLDSDTGALSVWGLPNDVVLTISAVVADKAVAMTTVRYYDPGRALSGALHEVAVLRCPDYVEVPRTGIGEVFLEDFKVTFQPFETYVDYSGFSSINVDAQDPRRGTFSFEVDWSNFEPETLVRSGSYTARLDGRIELRDVWLGPDQAQCGHVLERW